MMTVLNAVFVALATFATTGLASSVHAHRTLRVDAAHGSKSKTLITEGLHTELQSEAEARMLVQKPIRIVRGGAKAEGGGKQNYEHHDVTAKCGETIKVNSKSDKSDMCPEDACPYYAQDKTDDEFCSFRCVKEEECQVYNPAKPIGDFEKGVCRSCNIAGCTKCHPTAMEDVCTECKGSYTLLENGKCRWNHWTTFYIVMGVIGCILLPIILWVVDLCIRPTANEVGLEHGMSFREAQKLKQDADAEGIRHPWPLSTNLCSQLVAGPGMILHFNFQAFLIVWGALIALTWVLLAYFIDMDLMILGTRRFGTPRENCILVAWGYEKQKELMWVKVLFIEIVYVGSIVLHFLHCIRQLRLFQNIDYQNKTMKDYVAIMEGLPEISGKENVEEELKDLISEKSGVPKDDIVGVSVAWKYVAEDMDKSEEVDKALKKDLDKVENFEKPQLERGDVFYKGALRRWMFKQEKNFLVDEEEDDAEGDSAWGDEVKSMLEEMVTSPSAFVVFDTESARDTAVEALESSFGTGVKVCGTDLPAEACLVALECEPDTVRWENFGVKNTQKLVRLIAGFGAIIVACLFWAVVFYAPYAWYVMNFNYENGNQPGFEISFAFSMIVVIGNAIMYEVCARISDSVGFRFTDHREACYMILYCIACLFNVMLDFCTTYYTAYLVMVGLEFRNYFGQKLSDIDSFTKQFETYAMQRSLAENTFSYAFPSTYLIPFLIEPVVTIGLPLVIGRTIVRTQPDLQGRAAEEYVASIPLDMGRYADLLLDVILGVLIFYFPGGYTTTLFLGLAGSHMYIYAFDHWKILRNIPATAFASMDIDWWSQALLIPIIGMMASCLVFKYQCKPDLENRLEGTTLIVACCGAFFAHCIVQLAILVYVVPMFGKTKPEEEGPDVTFAELAAKKPCTWFTANPVHCLRSKHVKAHDPPMLAFHLGKEHFMSLNKAAGAFYESKGPMEAGKKA